MPTQMFANSFCCSNKNVNTKKNKFLTGFNIKLVVLRLITTRVSSSKCKCHSEKNHKKSTISVLKYIILTEDFPY